MTKQIFREQALDRLSSPEQLDRLMSLTSPRQWLALAGAGCLLAVAAVWAFCGSIVTTLDAAGVLTRPGGVAAARAVCSGGVAEILVAVGDPVQPGQELLRIRPMAAQSTTERLAVVSPAEGRVFNITVLEGDLVAEGEILVAVENVNRPLGAVVFVSAREGHRLHLHAEAQITLGAALGSDPHPYRGTVVKVGRFPVSHSAMGRTLQSEDWATSMAQYGPMLEVIVALGDAASEQSLVCGIPCQARIEVARRPPIQLILGGSGS